MPDLLNFFFLHYGLTNADLERSLSAALSAGGDYAELYFEHLTSSSAALEASIVTSASNGVSLGCGVRVLDGEYSGYAVTDEISPKQILHAARTAALIANGTAKTRIVEFHERPTKSFYPVTRASVDLEMADKVELLARAEKAALAYDSRVNKVRASYADELRNILVVASDGTFANDCATSAEMGQFETAS